MLVEPPQAAQMPPGAFWGLVGIGLIGLGSIALGRPRVSRSQDADPSLAPRTVHSPKHKRDSQRKKNALLLFSFDLCDMPDASWPLLSLLACACLCCASGVTSLDRALIGSSKFWACGDRVRPQPDDFVLRFEL